jgi:hypothetical protein
VYGFSVHTLEDQLGLVPGTKSKIEDGSDTGTSGGEVVTEHLEHLEHLECSLQPSPPGCFTKKLSEARGNGIGFVTAG